MNTIYNYLNALESAFIIQRIPTDILVTPVGVITPIVIHIGGSRPLHIIILNPGSREVGRSVKNRKGVPPGLRK